MGTKLREEVHRSIDALDSASLALVYEQVQSLLRIKSQGEIVVPAPSLDEVLALTASSTHDWHEDIIASRDDRLR